MDGIVVDFADLRILDTRELPWEAMPGIPGGQMKTLVRGEGGLPLVYIVYLPPGSPLPDLPHRHFHRTVHERSLTLWGELPHWEYETAEQQHGTLSIRRAGYYMHRLPGSIHGLEPGVVSPIGWSALQWREGPGNWVGEPEFATETEDVPYDDGWQPRDTEETLADDRGVVIDWGDLSVLDTRELPWEERGGLGGSAVKILERDENGLPLVQLRFIEAGFTVPDLPYRHRHRTVSELALSLWGELPHWEYESAAQARGVQTDHRAGMFMHRLPGSIHGLEEGPVSPTGYCAITWRTAAGTWIGEPGFEEETEHVAYPS